MKNELGLRNVGVFRREKVWLENSLSQKEGGCNITNNSVYFRLSSLT